MKKTYLQKGFTLIELLVVIAIIGILSSVVSASLNTARNKAADTAVKSNLANARAEAEIFYDTQATATYDGVCANTATANIIGDNVFAAKAAYGGSIAYAAGDGTASTFETAVCHDSATAWAAVVPLKASVNAGTATFWCVDSTGASRGVTTLLAANVTVCPST